MADRYLIASGDSNDPAIFDGGTLPAAGDVLRLNGLNLNIVADFTVDEITNNATGGATSANGTVTIQGGVTLNANCIHRGSGASYAMMFASFGNATSIINGNGLHLTNGSGSAVLRVTGQSGGELILNGDWRHEGSSIGNSALRAIDLFGDGQGFKLTCNGEISGSYSTGGGMQPNMHGIYCATGYEINFNGIVTGRNANNTSTSTAVGCVLTGSNNIINVNGLALGGTTDRSSSSAGISAGNTSNVVNLFGMAQATTINNGIVNGTVVYKSGCSIMNLVTQQGVAASAVLIDGTGDIQIAYPIDANNDRNLYTASLLTGYPLEADVEDGVTYGPVGEFTGTLDPVVIDTAQLASNLLNEMNSSNLTIAQGLRDGMGASAAAIAAVGSINVIP